MTYPPRVHSHSHEKLLYVTRFDCRIFTHSFTLQSVCTWRKKTHKKRERRCYCERNDLHIVVSFIRRLQRPGCINTHIAYSCCHSAAVAFITYWSPALIQSCNVVIKERYQIEETDTLVLLMVAHRVMNLISGMTVMTATIHPLTCTCRNTPMCTCKANTHCKRSHACTFFFLNFFEVQNKVLQKKKKSTQCARVFGGIWAYGRCLRTGRSLFVPTGSLIIGPWVYGNGLQALRVPISCNYEPGERWTQGEYDFRLSGTSWLMVWWVKFSPCCDFTGSLKPLNLSIAGSSFQRLMEKQRPWKVFSWSVSPGRLRVSGYVTWLMTSWQWLSKQMIQATVLR